MTMTAPEIVTIAGNEYRFKFTIAAVVDAQRMTEQTFGQLVMALGTFDVFVTQVLIQAALRHPEGPRNKQGQLYTLLDAGELFETWIEDGADLTAIDAVLMRATESSGLLRHEVVSGIEGEESDSPKVSMNGGEITNLGPIALD